MTHLHRHIPHPCQPALREGHRPGWRMLLLIPLAGVSLGLPVFHIMEPEIKAQIDPDLYKEQLELMEIALDVDAITQGLNRVRNKQP